jgi:lipopolysaccharide transport system permease protein
LSSNSAARGEIVIEPGRAIRHYWQDLWRYRELFYFMAWRDVLLRYKQTSIGFAWAVLRPFLTMLVFTLIFSKLARLPSGGVPYPLLVYAGMLPWQFFATAFADAGNSLVNKETIISKVYFPRLIIPAAAVMVSFADFLAAGSVLVGLMAWFGSVPDWRLCFLPAFIVVLFFVALGAGLWISALSAKYKDFRYVIPFVVQMGLYLSPVGFHSSLIPEDWRTVYSLNPMVGIIEGFRWAILGVEAAGLERDMALSGAGALLLLGSGLLYFRRMERSLAEVL